jgi:hypothetical protein
VNIFDSIRQRINSAVAAVIGAIFLFICGAIFAFYLSPSQAIEWRRIQGMPEADAATIEGLAGESVAATGTLADNEVIFGDSLVAYSRESWVVDPADPDNEDDTASGYWDTLEDNYPALNLTVNGGTLTIQGSSGPTIGGALHETVEPSAGGEVADYDNQPLSEGSIRTQGFQNGDVVTVVGTARAGGIIEPSRLYAGNRTDLVADVRTGAQAFFIVGMAFMICSPIVLITGIVSAIFGRQRAARAEKAGSGSFGDASGSLSGAGSKRKSPGGSFAKGGGSLGDDDGDSFAKGGGSLGGGPKKSGGGIFGGAGGSLGKPGGSAKGSGSLGGGSKARSSGKLRKK